MKSLTKLELESFLLKLNKEIHDINGTWSFKTFDWLRLNSNRFLYEDTFFLINPIILELIEKNSNILIKFKISQLLSQLNFLNFPFFKDILLNFKSNLIELINLKPLDDILWFPMIDLLKNII